MRTVRIMFVMAVVLATAVPAIAQEKKAARRKAAKISQIARSMLRMEKLRSALDELDLTADQQEKLDKVREELRPKMAIAFKQIQEILTEEQRTVAEETGRKAREAGKESRDLILAVESALELTDEQKKTMDKVAEEQWRPLLRETTKKVMGTLTSEQKETVKKKLSAQPRKGRKQGEKTKRQKAASE